MMLLLQRRGVQRKINGSKDKMMSLQHGLVHNQKAILNELDENNTFFDNFVDMIPANLYVAGNTGMFHRFHLAFLKADSLLSVLHVFIF